MRIPIAVRGYQGRSLALDCERMVNFYKEIDPDGKAKGSLIGVPGSNLFANLGAAAVRGMHPFNGLMYVVEGAYLYSVNNAGVSTKLNGSNPMATSNGRIVMENNGLAPTGGNQLAITDGVSLYIYNVNSGAWTVPTLPQPVTGTNATPFTVTFIDGYFICDIGGAQFAVSAAYDGTTWSGLDKGAASVFPDSLLTVLNVNENLMLFGGLHTEPWYDQAGGTHPPFALISGATMMYGIGARYSVATGDNSAFWLATQKTGNAGPIVGIARLNGYGAQIISPPAINWAISQMSTVSDAFGFCMIEGGHTFYVITFPTGNRTFVYDASLTGVPVFERWHERSSYVNNPYAIGRWLANSYCYFNGKHYIGDYQNGNIYQLDDSFLTENGSPVVGMWQGPHIYDPQGLKRIFYTSLQLDMEMGTATLSSATQALTNGNFETGALTPWTLTVPAGESATASILNTGANSGTYCAKVSVTTPGQAQCTFQQGSLSLTSGNTYSLTFAMYADSPRMATVQIREATNNSDCGIGIQTVQLSTGWNTFAFYFAANQTVANAYLEFDLDASNGATYYIDDVSLSTGGAAQAVLQFSDDGGHTWGNEKMAPLGAQGAYKTRARWTRLGQSRDRVPRIVISDACKRILFDVYIEGEVGTN